MVAPLQIYILAKARETLEEARRNLASERYVVHVAALVEDGLKLIRERDNQIDCLIVESALLDDALWQRLTDSGVLVPLVILVSSLPTAAAETSTAIEDFIGRYHSGVVTLPLAELSQIEATIHQAIQQFLALSADSCLLPQNSPSSEQLPAPSLLSAQQERLTDKLKARLGYLGVYYKRNPDHFLRNMSQADRETLLRQLRTDYRKIILGYFANDSQLNQNIDDFVNQTFMADISVSYIVEIHMELMDDFSKQLKLEGRSEEILLDYRLTLIDVIAHLCEMYRRSIPRQP